MSAASVHPALRRDRGHAVVGGVGGALAGRLGVDPLLVRVLFVAGAFAGGTGVVLYALAWLLIPAQGEGRPAVVRLAGRRETWQVASGMALLVLAVLLAFRELGLWFSDALVWPTVLAAAGGALIWRQSLTAAAAAGAPPAPERATVASAAGPAGGVAGGAAAAAPASATRAVGFPTHADGSGVPGRALPRADLSLSSRTGLGTGLVVSAALAFLYFNDALRPARDVVLAVLAVVVALALILAPWWVALVRGFGRERAERIRSQERAELAAHLHDSVLQTLALVQRRADDPREVATLARRQERELRAWLNSPHPPGAPGPPRTLAPALEAVAAEVEETHGVPVEVVAVGDGPLDPRGEALVAAVREALVNAAKFAGAAPISLYAEVAAERVVVFVRDRGPGFDPTSVPGDRRGVRESIVGRMARHGGRATVHTAPGAGTEVELVMERE